MTEIASSADNITPHRIASQGFQAEADAYAKARPSYPTEAIDYICSNILTTSDNKKVLDLGAGTGIMTKLLVERGFQVTAVEPVDNMRLKIETMLPTVNSLKGTAWSIPVDDNSQDMVVLAQCFHWFDDIKSLREIFRVLKPGGAVALIWNMESKERSEWVAKLRELYEAFDADAPQYRKGHWKNVFETDDAKSLYKLPLEHQRFEFDTLVKRSNIWTRITSKSYIAVLDQEEQNKLHEKVDLVLDDSKFQLPKNGSDEDIIYRHDTDLFWCFKK